MKYPPGMLFIQLILLLLVFIIGFIINILLLLGFNIVVFIINILLTGRKQHVCVNGSMSKWADVTSAV